MTTRRHAVAALAAAGLLVAAALGGEEPGARKGAGVDGDTFELAAGEYVHMVVRPRDLDAEITLLDPQGRAVVETAMHPRYGDQDLLFWVAETAGTYRLRVRPRTPGTGNWGFEIAERRPASAEDAPRARAMNAYQHAQHLPRDRDGLLRAIALYREAHQRFQAIGVRDYAASSLNNAAKHLQRLGRLDEALATFEEALATWGPATDPTTATYRADTLQNLGSLTRLLGETRRSVEVLDEAIALYRSTDATISLARALVARGQTASQRGEFQSALDAYREALELAQKGGDRRLQAQALNNLGAVHASLGDLPRAREDYEESLHLHEDENLKPGLAVVLNNIGYLYEQLGETDAAQERYRRALEVLAAAEPALKFEAFVRENLAHSDLALGHHAAALAGLQQARALRQQAMDPYGEANTLVGLAAVHTATGAVERAAAELREALELAGAFGDRQLESKIRVELARDLRRLGDPEAALAEVEKALEHVETERSQVLARELRASFFASRHDWYELEVELLVELDQSKPGRGYAQRALRASERARARGLVELLAEARLDVRRGISNELRERIREVDERISALQQGLLDARIANSEGDAVAVYEAALERTENERQDVEEEVRRRHPRYARLRYPEPPIFDAVRSLAGTDGALLEYALGDHASTLFVVTREGLRWHTLPGRREIETEVEEARRRLREPSARRGLVALESALHGLYQTLVAPAEAELRDKTRLLVVPDGALYYLSFEALLSEPPKAGAGPEALAYLIRRTSVTVVPSAGVLAGLPEPAANPPLAFLGVGDPAFGRHEKPGDPGSEVRGFFADRGGSLARLRGSGDEVRRIAKLFAGRPASVLVRGDATEERVKAEIGRARYVQLATHGLISEDHPQLSGLALTLDDDPSEDGLLQVYEIFELDIGAELVVLSACETGLGQALDGEGLIGLSHAFFYAGTPSVVVSLWPVADRSTGDLMESLYRHLAAGEGRAEALRQAKLELLGSGRFAHPYFWAPFVLVGRP